MNTIRLVGGRLALLSVIALGAAGCLDTVTSPVAEPDAGALWSSTSYGATLLECPVDVTRSVSATIGIDGGVLSLDGHEVAIPVGAVLLPTEFTLTVPASNYVEIDVRAAGQEHFDFLEPVALTISYSRCTRSNIDKKTLRVFYIDSASNAILEDLGGTDDKTARSVTTSTDHLSDYALGSAD